MAEQDGKMSVIQYLQTINDGLMAEMVKHKESLPAGFNKERFALNCTTVISDMLKDNKRRNSLNGVSFNTIITTMIKGAYLGLDFFNGECYAIPYGSEMQFQTDYKGEIKLCKKYSKNKIKDIFAKVVREGDDFYEEVNTGVQKVYFRPKPFSNGTMIGAFAVATFFDGSMIYETMSADEIENIRRSFSKAKDSPAWSKTPGEMYKKTVLRRLCKMIDLDFDNIEQRKAYDDGGDSTFDQPQTVITEKEKPVDVTSQIREARRREALPPAKPVQKPVQTMTQNKTSEPQPVQQDDDYERYEQQYADIPEGMEDGLPFK